MRADSKRWRVVASRTVLLAVVAAALAAACTSILGVKDPTVEGDDQPGDAKVPDAAVDAATDAAIDSAIDGPPAVCTTGACCSPQGQFEPATKSCSTATEFQCSASCAGHPQSRTVEQFCSGNSAICDGQVTMGTFSDMGAACGADQICETQQGGAAPRCSACGFGCDPTANACRPAKLFVLISVGGFQPNAFGTRAAFDARCAADFADRTHFPDRGCTPSHAHAVISVSSADSISLMASTYGIPASTPVHRVDDDAFVTGSWNNLIDSTVTTTGAPSSLPPGNANGMVWTGINALDCLGWSSNSSGERGCQGDTTSATPLRLNKVNQTCNLNGHLLCVCWSGP